MTPEAVAFINSTVQHIKTRMFDPKYRIILNAHSFQAAADSDFGNVIFWRDMMLLGSVLLPAEPTPAEGGDKPAFYLDDAAARALIQAELDITLRDFMRNVHVASWAAYLAAPGAHRGGEQLVRRFYVVDRDDPFGWSLARVPTEIEKDAEGSTIPGDAVCLPDFEAVTDQMRYAALGL